MTGFIDYGFDVRYVIFSCQYLQLVAAAEYGIAVRDYFDASALSSLQGDEAYEK